ncbi:MAG: hypothetical protein GY821_08620 [Gammaproteobacteria bacterium]|nr:hypothetical protein [Gammaproteobacteria bacterium]
MAAKKQLFGAKVGCRCVVWQLSIDSSADGAGFTYPSVVYAEYTDCGSGNKFFAVEYKKKTV